MDSSDLRNAIPKNEEPIPYINTDNKPDNKTTESKDSVCQTDVRRSTRTDQDVAEVITLWNQLADIGINPVKGISSSSKRYKNLKARIRQYGIEPVKEAHFFKAKTKMVGALLSTGLFFRTISPKCWRAIMQTKE